MVGRKRKLHPNYVPPPLSTSSETEESSASDTNLHKRPRISPTRSSANLSQNPRSRNSPSQGGEIEGIEPEMVL